MAKLWVMEEASDLSKLWVEAAAEWVVEEAATELWAMEVTGPTKLWVEVEKVQRFPQ